MGVVFSKIARAALAGLAVLAVTACLMAAQSFTTSEPARAADLTQFQPGNIIDDSLFFDANAMSIASIQSFLNAKVPRCVAGYTCLKSYSESTRTLAGTPMCSQYNGAGGESAATIIYKVAQTCGISPKVLLVTLQKEQSLVTDSSPGSNAYRSAMGAGCPDTAACDANYYGFFNQVHYGAYLLKRYTQPAGTGPGTAYDTRFDLRFPVNRTSAIQYNPNAACGSRAVYVQNQATHALYIYTPYTPNDFVLAGSGGDPNCKAYGNRNFFAYYSDWFGTTHGPAVGLYFQDYYTANSSWLGTPTTAMVCGGPDSGCSQSYQGGVVAGSYSTVAAGVHNDYAQFWGYYGREYGPLRYPTTEYRCDNMLNGGCRQEFQGGWIVSFTGSGIIVVPGAVRSTWSDWGREFGPLGVPTAGQTCDLADGGCRQGFTGGWVVTHGTRSDFVPTAVLSVWQSWGREANILGFPAGAPSADPTTGNYTQAFQGGVITVSNGVGALTSASDPWVSAQLTSPWLGTATAAKSCTLKNGACYQPYQNGWIVQSPAGVAAVPTAALTTWTNYGREYNFLGFPTTAPSTTPTTTGNYTQTFQGGTITVTGGVAAITAASDPWVNAQLTSPWLGTATAAKSCTLKNGACYQPYQNGWIVQSPAGVAAVPTAVLTTWTNYGREYNFLGFPTTAPSTTPTTTGNYTQTFQGGTITVTGGVAAITAASDPWVNEQLTSPWLGTATAAKSCTLKNGACYQPYQNGWIVQSPAGVAAVPTAVLTTWTNYGREYNFLGFPTTAPSTTPTTTGNYTQTFQGGTITVTGGVGAALDAFTTTALASSWLGSSTQAKSCTMKGGACYQQFQNGWIVQSPTGTFAVSAAVLQAWGWYGREYDVMGFPIGAPSASPATGTYTQSFQGGLVTVTNGTPVVTLS